MKVSKAELIAVIRKVEKLIEPGKIDTIRLTDAEALRLERARRELSKATGTPYP
jgi:hypothetical protein